MAVRALLSHTTVLDRGIVAALLLMTAASFWLVRKAVPGERVVVERGGKVVFTAPLATEHSVSLPGPLGETLVTIHDGRVCIDDSPCPLKVCMGMGEVSRTGELLACVPNDLLVRIEGAEEEERGYDLLSR